MSADGILGSDICRLGLEPDYIKMTCSIDFQGNIAPTLTWSDLGKDVGSNASTNESVIENHSRATSTLVVQANEKLNEKISGQLFYKAGLEQVSGTQ